MLGRHCVKSKVKTVYFEAVTTQAHDNKLVLGGDPASIC